MPTYDTSTGVRALEGSNPISDIDAGFLAMAQDVVALIAATTPPGTLTATARAAAPTGWLLCDGAAISRSTYNNLFAAIGTTYGVGNGSTTFNIPDLRGRVPVGVDGAAARLAANDALGNSSGAETHTLTTPQIPAHTHNYEPTIAAGVTVGSGVYYSPENSANSDSAVTTSTGGGGAHNNMQPYQVVNWMVKI